MNRVLLMESARVQLLDFAERARPHETGGLLLGFLGDRDPWIADVVEIPMKRARRTSYRIPAGVTCGIVADRVLQDPDIGYLGDWHSHPSNQTRSTTDRATLAVLTLGGMLQRRRVMLIVRLTAAGWVISTWRRPRFREIECRVELTGPAPNRTRT
jgi:hypothetical protein